MKKLVVEKVLETLRPLYGSNFKVYEDDGAKMPVCTFPCSTSNPEHLIKIQEEYANLFAAAPELLEIVKSIMKNILLTPEDAEKLQKVIDKAEGRV